jgi:hypothetical protein
MRKNGSYASSNPVSFGNRSMPDANALDVRNGVERPWRQDADHKPDLPRTRTLCVFIGLGPEAESGMRSTVWHREAHNGKTRYKGL